MTMAVVVVRSTIDIKPPIGHTMKLLRLRQINHCVLVPEDEYHKGMLQKIKDYVTWGEVDAETVSELLGKRGRVTGDRGVSDKFVKDNSRYGSIGELGAAIAKGETRPKDVSGLKPLFRLSPPRKGWGGIKQAYSVGGALGYRGGAINDLIRRMI